MLHLHPKLNEALTKLRMTYPYFGEFNFFVNFIQNERVETACCYIQNLSPVIDYSGKFLDGLSVPQIQGLLLHEDFHLIMNHHIRGKNGGYDKKKAGIVKDMIINSIIVKHYPKVELPPDGCYIPKEYTGIWVWEALYAWMQDNNKWGKGSSNAPGFDNHSKLDSLPAEIKELISQKITTALAARGLQTADEEAILGALRKPKRDYLKEIIRELGALRGSKPFGTFSRPNRRGIEGLKGTKKLSAEINTMLDVSGSMMGEFEHALSYIFRNDIVVNLIQCDTEVKEPVKVKSMQALQKVVISGGGGTELQPGINYIRKNLPKLPTLILTDGYCDSLDLSGMGKVLIISVGEAVNIEAGKASQIMVEKEKEEKAS